ncbi:MAG: glycosyltransferase, partial [Planctomycetaceae bacterium]|nr:glycosyltransferase [Planctomycetaceae bacterium]
MSDRRIAMLRILQSSYPNSCVTQALFNEMAAVYSQSRIGFNCSVADDINMRQFEIPAHGIPLVTNRVEDNGMEELFTDGQHLLTFGNEDELLSAIDRLLSDVALRQRITQSGYDHVLAHHTYQHRMQVLYETCTQHKRQFQSATISKHVDDPQRSFAFEVTQKSDSYFEFARPDVQTLIPDTVRHILDIGCGAGALGASLKQVRSVSVTGIEANANAAARARLRLDYVLCQPIDDVDPGTFDPGTFDCIVLADILEHLRDPIQTLRKCRQWLATDGCVIVSVPNSRHHSVVTGLIHGNWTYERAGLLDEDHVRCFTLREIQKLLYRSGFRVTHQMGIPGSGHREWKQSGQTDTVHFGGLHISGLDPAEAEDFFIYQHLLQATPDHRRSFGLTSIVIATWNQLACTRECVDSILIRTDEPFELIFVDNGSTDGTPTYLETIPHAKVIRNTENLGFAKAVNQGLAVAQGSNIVLLNNDCVVSTGWLYGLLESLYDNELNGLAGPVSNNVSGEQQISVPYQDLSGMDGFAWSLRGKRSLSITDRLVGFCLAFRRSLLDQIGTLDEQFRIGCFEDDDFCRRTIQAGYRAVIAQHVFVHHYGSVTFQGAGFDLGEILEENQKRYAAKWNPNRPTADNSVPPAPRLHEPKTVSQRYTSVNVEDGVLLQRRHIRLSLCMIVRDNEDTIEACLDSIYPWVDEIIVVDTGSRDRTPDICRRFGARMFEFPWIDDFSAARNESLRYARGEWIFWMDSDDIIEQDQGRRLRQLAYSPHTDDCFGYVMQVQCRSSTSGQMTVFDHVKVFRNLPELRFEHRIHEQILPAIRRLGGN